MRRRKVRRITLWLVVGLVVLGCASPVLVTPPPAPVSEPVETIIVQTAAVAQTQTAIVLPPTETQTTTPAATQTITITPTPTATFLFTIQTVTSLPEGLFADDDWYDDNDDEDSGYVKPEVVREWDCRFISQSPPKGTVIKGGTDFTAVWVVENTGTKTWPKQGVDIVYHSGAHLHDGKPYYDIPTAVGPGGRVTITVSMAAPKLSKTYSTRWSLRVGRRDFCSVKFSIEVK